MSVGVIIAFIAFGGLIIFNYFHSGSENRKISSWPKTKAKILDTTVVSFGGRRWQKGLQVQYEFYVDGKRYQSDKVYATQTEFRFNSDYVKVEELPFLKDPMVMYNPLKPENCCILLYPDNWVATLFLVLGIVFSLVGWIGLAFKIWN